MRVRDQQQNPSAIGLQTQSARATAQCQDGHDLCIGSAALILSGDTLQFGEHADLVGEGEVS